jgi:SAM-dependent methyltransferase
MEATVPSNWLQENTPESWATLARPSNPDFVAADWGSARSQEARLKAALELPIAAGDTVLDFACGTGRLADFLPDGVTYEGLDWSAEMVELARSRRPDHAFRVGSSDDISPADWIIASGPFNYAHSWSKEDTFEVLRRMWRLSARGIAATLFTADESDRLRYGPAEVLASMEDADWEHLEVDRSYLPHDMCLRAWRSMAQQQGGCPDPS